MAIGTGTVSFSDIRTEFGMSGAISFSQLYRGGSNVRGNAVNNSSTNLAAGVPTSGAIAIDDFKGQARGFRYTYSAGATNQNASDLFGDDYAVNYPKEIVINAGVELGATATSNEALQIDAGGTGDITVTNNGTLSGAGGAGAASTLGDGSNGGDAFEANVSCTLVNNGTIRGGGGGGGGGGQGSGPATGVTVSGPSFSFDTHYIGQFAFASGVCESLPIRTKTALSGGNFFSTSNGFQCPSNANGGCITAGNARNNEDACTVVFQNPSRVNGAAGGRGEGYNQTRQTGSNASNSNAGDGGDGGLYGANGQSGANGNVIGTRTTPSATASGGTGGLSGVAIRGISNVSYTNNGTEQGGTA